MHQDDCAVLGKNNVRLAGEPSAAKTVAQSPLMEGLANKDLQLRVCPTDPRHLRGSLLRGETINQDQAFAFCFEGVASEGELFTR